MANLDIKGNVSLNTADAEKGLGRVEQAAGRMAAGVGRAGKEAAKGVGDMGAGGDEAARKVDRATGSIINSIQRATAAAQAGQRGTAGYFEELAKQRGGNVGALQPYLDTLRQVEQAQKSASAGFAAGAAGIEKIGMSAKATANAMRNVPAQFTDIVVSLQGGQQPLTVLLQQGGQLKDMFGGAGNAARALGTYVMGLVNPYTVLAAAVAGLGLALYAANGREADMQALSTRLSGTGRASVAAAGDIRVLVQELSLLPGVSKASATAIVTEFSKVSGVGGDLFAGLGSSVADFAAATGMELPAAAKRLATAFADPAKGAKDLEDALGTLTASQLLSIEKMAALGDKSGAQLALMAALKTATLGLALEAMTPLGRAADSLGNAWTTLNAQFAKSDALQAANRGLAALIEKSIALAVRLSQLRPPEWLGKAFSGGLNGLVMGAITGGNTGGATGTWKDDATTAAITSSVEQENRAKSALEATKGFESQAGAMAKLRATAKQAKEALGELEKQNKGNSIEATTLRDRIVGLNERLESLAKKNAPKPEIGQSELAGLKARITEERDYIAQLQERGKAAEKANEGEKLAAKYAEELQGKLDKRTRTAKEALLVQAQTLGAEQRIRSTLEARLKLEDELRQQQDKTLDAAFKAGDAIAAQALAQEQANATFGLGKAALGEYTLAQLEQQRADLQATDNVIPGYLLAIEQQIDAQKRLIAAMRSGEVMEAGKKAADEAKKDWDKAADGIRNSLTDALLRGFESGKGFLKNLRDTAINMFQALVLRPVIQGTVAPIAQSIVGMIGGKSSGGGAIDALGTLTGLGTNFGSGISAGFSALIGESGITGALSAGMTSIGTATGAGIASGLGTIAGALGPIALGIGVAASLLMSKKDNRYGSQYGYEAGQGTAVTGGPNRGVDFAGQSAAVNSVVETINGIFTRVGSADRLAQFGAGFESSEKGKGFSFAGGRLASGGAFGQQDSGNNRGSKTPEQALAEFSTELKQATLQALAAATDIPKAIAAQLQGVNIDALGGSALDALIGRIDQQIASVEAFRKAVTALPFENLKRLSFDAASGLLAAAGGLDALASGLSSYYENFYSAEEKRAQSIRSINAAIGGGFDAAVTSRAQFRALVEAQDLSTEAGQRMYAGLVGVSGAFAALSKDAANAADAVAASKADLVDAYKREADAMQGTVEKFRAFAADLRAFRDGLLTGGLSPLTPGQKYAQAGDQFDALVQKSRTGTVAERADAAGKLQGAATTLLDASRAYNASGSAFSQDFDRVREALNEAAINASATADVAQLQLSAAQAQLTALGEINKSVLSVAQALAAYGAARGVPAFAAGGDHAGGWAMVGEQGPELAYLPPSRIYSAADTTRMNGAGGAGVEQQLAAVVAELTQLRRQQSQETGAVIQAGYDASDKNAQALAALQSRAAWAEKRKVALV